MTRFPIYCLLVIVGPLLMAADAYSPPELVAPKDNGLKLVSTQNFCCDAKFSGQIWVSGVVTAQEANVPDSEVGEPELVLVPDDKSMQQLPYFTRYEIKGITLTNYAEAVSMVFGKDAAKKMMKKVQNQKMEGRFLIEEYEVGIECDYPWANAQLVSANIPPKIAVVGNYVVAHCG